MNKAELKELLFNNLVYHHEEDGLVYDYCNNCNKPVIQVDFNEKGYVCEYCQSHNISMEQVQE